MSKRKKIFRVVLALCACVVVVFGSTESESESESNHSQASHSNLKLVTSSEFSLVLQSFEAQQMRIQELENSHLELKEQFKSSKKRCDEQLKTLRKEVDELKAESSLNENVWLLTPPLRGRRGQKGEKGDSGVIEAKQPPVQKGEQSSATQLSKGDQSHRIPVENFPLDPQSITSCSVAMEISSSPRSKKQIIYPRGNSKSLEVLCDFETDGGGWTIIQKRSSEQQNIFARNWSNYSSGFGSLTDSFWIGLENIHALTKNGDQELRIELEDFDGNKRWAKYSRFSISSASDYYRLSIGGFSRDSTAGDSMINPDSSGWVSNGMRFTTKDVDNDGAGNGNCGDWYHSGWWFNDCGAESNLNGVYRENGVVELPSAGIIWVTWKGKKYSLAKTEMKIRRRQ